MNFDQTYIAIRKRNLLEILDLSLHVIRDYFGPLSMLWLIGVLPFFAINWFLFGWLAEDYYDFENVWWYFYLMILIVFNQSQVATIFMTKYLGQAIFSQRPSVKEAIISTLKINPYFFWIHGVLRMVAPVLIIAFFIGRNSNDSQFANATTWISLLTFCGLIVRWIRPFASEILSLEKTPILKKSNRPVNYSLRSSSLHKAANAELTGRFFLMCMLVPLLAGTVLGTLLTIDSFLGLNANAEYLPTVFYGPLALWIVSGIVAVARFLSYIDIRIRQEGWEVELRMRAEAIRLEKAMV